MTKFNVKPVLLALGFLSLTFTAYASQLSPTIYYIKTIDLNRDCKVKKTIMSVEGKKLFSVCKDSYQLCVIEGTCAILKEDSPETAANADGVIKEPAVGSMQMNVSTESDFEVINFVKQNNSGTALFMAVDEEVCPWGYGVSQICLDPYYSVAADLHYHKAGDVIFVNKLKGLQLPNGETHSGFMIVRDRGGAIKGADRFDFYTGILDYRDQTNPFTPVGFATASNKFEYRKATSDESNSFRKFRNFPKIPVGE